MGNTNKKASIASKIAKTEPPPKKKSARICWDEKSKGRQ